MYELRLTPQRVTLVLLIIVGMLSVGGVVTQYIKHFYGHDTQLGLVRLFALEGENNLPAWYSSVALLFSSTALAAIGLCRKQQRKPYASSWLGLAVLFFYLSADEGASIHEMAAPPIHQWLENRGYLDSVLQVIGTSWLLAGIPFAVIIFLLFWRFLFHLPTATRTLFLLGGGLFVAGAIGMEALGGHYLGQHDHNLTFTYAVMVAVEETLEMLGVVVFIYGLMTYMAEQTISFQIRLN